MYHSGFGGYGQAFGQRGDRRIADGQEVEVCGGQLARIGAPRGAVFEGECCTSFRVAGEDLEQCCSFRAAYRAGERFTGTFTFDEHNNPVKSTAILTYVDGAPVLKEMF
jgi:hypothetical protein